MKRKQLKYLVWLFLVMLFVQQVGAQTFQGSFEEKFRRYSKGDSYTGSVSSVWKAVAWKGERIHGQIILWSGQTIEGMTYRVSNLVNGVEQINADQIQLRFGKYVKGDRQSRGCGKYGTRNGYVEIADALSETQTQTLSPQDPIKMWVTIDVPGATKAGSYHGTIKVSGGSATLTFTLKLEVVDRVLPPVADWDFHLDLWQFPKQVLDHYNSANATNTIALWSPQHYALLEPSYRKLADMGQKVITTYIKGGSLGAPSMVTWTLRNDGIWSYDFSVFDHHVNTLKSWGITKQISCFSPVGWNENAIPYFDEATGSDKEMKAPIGSAIYNKRWSHFLTAFKKHLEGKGWFEQTVLYLDEVSEEKLKAVASMVHGNHADWKLGIAYAKGLSRASKANFYDLSGILEDASNEGIADDKISTFYTSCTQTRPNNYITPENNPAEMTWMGWHALSRNYDGYLRWAFDYWRRNEPFDARDGAHTAGDFSMIYRNANSSPMTYSSSIRMEMLREGIQDYEKVKILKAALAGSTDPFDAQASKALEKLLLKFGKTSGTAAKSLVSEGQQLLAQIAANQYGHCRVDGTGQKGAYIKKLSAGNGKTNINFQGSGYPKTGYLFHTATQLNLLPGNTFEVSLENSADANCSITRVWVDWNGDFQFSNEDELVYSGGKANACNNGLQHNFRVTVPAKQAPGTVRMRVRIGSGSPLSACGSHKGSVTVDYAIAIRDAYCQPSGDKFQNYYLTRLTTSNLTSSDKHINYSGIGFPVGGYHHHTADQLSIGKGGTFTLQLKNSAASKCAQTVVWIDWNGDGDFEDKEEKIAGVPNKAQSCENATAKTISVQVPDFASPGTTRMRIRLRDAWLASPTACLKQTKSSAFDFEVRITERKLVTNINVQEQDKDTLIYPNPAKGFFEISPLTGNVQIRVHALSGRQVASLSYKDLNKSTVRVDTMNWESGIYLIQIYSSAQKPKVYRFVVL